MEKTNSRSSSAKSTTSDSKIKQDVANKFLRVSRNKESISPRPETRRKPNPQRNREFFDKRPKTRTGAVCEKYWSEIADDSVYDSHTKIRNKKVNLNHLLNFTVTPLDNREVGRTLHNRSKLPKYNKELFLQANCQFVVKKDGNYAVHLENPDILVEWSLIEEILLPSYEAPLCPICLYTPVAAKITRCGHVYCWPCMLHYLALTDRTWQKCPICFDAVYKTELKSVSLKLNTSFNVGKEITMRLMKREKKSLLPIPATMDYSVDLLCNLDNDEIVTRFQKLLLANKSQMLCIIKREFSELMEAYGKEKNNPESCFIEEALKLLSEREASIKNESTLLDNEFKITVKKDEPFTDAHKNLLPTRQHTISQSSADTQDSSHDDDAFDIEEVNSPTESVENGAVSRFDAIQETGRKDICYFYQAEDGQHIYLHNINMRMIVKEYGSLEEAPELIKANIVELERVSMTEIMRKRFRYLKHLPLTCEFQIVELKFSPIVSKSTIQLFEGEIMKRKHLRDRKARDERRREKYIEQEENRKLGKYPRATYNLKSPDQFPVFDVQNDFQPLFLQCASSKPTSNIIENVESIGNEFLNLSVADYHEADVATSGTSFAQMLKDGHTKTYKPPPSNKRMAEIVHQTLDPDEDGWVPPPEYHQSFSDAIQIALDAATSRSNLPAESQKSSKKKKGKKKVLFTTAMCRNK